MPRTLAEPIGKAYKPWIIASVAILVGSLFLLTLSVFAGFVFYQGADKPIWLILLAILAVLGIALGFAGFFMLMLTAGWRSFREGKKIQVISPAHPAKD